MSARLKKMICLLAVSAVLAAAGVLFAACGEKKEPPQAVDASTIKYDGSLFSWTAPDGATSYTITVNGTQLSVPNGTSRSYPAVSFPADTYEFSIVAENEYGTSESVSKSFYRLETIGTEDITFDETGKMSWTPVVGALEYVVEVNGEQTVTPATEFSDFVYGERNQIRIKSNGTDDTYFSFWSETLSKTYLASPTDVAYDGQYITWKGSSAAREYTVYINGGLYETSTSTKLLYDAQDLDFTVEVAAEGDGVSSFPSGKSEEKEFLFLGQVKNIRVSEGVLLWDAVDNATAYLIRVNGSSEKRVTETQYTLTAGSSQTVSIRPVASDEATYFSSWTDQQSFFVLRAPQLLWDSAQVPDGTPMRNLYWNAVNGDVSGYNIRVTTPSGEQSDTYTDSAQPSFLYGFDEVGEYSVSVQSVAGTGTGTENSAFSAPITVIRLAAPNQDAQNFIASDASDLTEGFDVYYTSVSGASRYRLYKDGTQTQITSATPSMHVTQVVEQDSMVQRTITYGIASEGSVKTIGGETVVTLSSLTKDMLTFDVTVLPAPTNVNISGGVVTWDANLSANGYTVNIGTLRDVDYAQYNLSSITTAGSYELSVCSRGNGKEVLPSSYTAALSITKLSAPTGIRVDTTVNEGQLLWDSVRNASSYNIYFNGSNEPIDDTQLDNINNYITVDTVTVVIEAVADTWNADHTEYFISSNRSNTALFTKLAPVTFNDPTFTSTELLWNPPVNYSGAVSYQVYDGQGYLYDGRIDGTRMDLSTLKAGYYTFYVKCIGDGTNTINSDLSTPVSIEKLETPDVVRSDTVYTWNRISGAVSYTVYLDGTLAATILQEEGKAAYEFKPAFDSIKTYTVTVTAIGDGGYKFIDSTPFELKQVVNQLSAPKISFYYDKESYQPDGNIVITVDTEGRELDTGYRYIVNDVIVCEATTEASYSYNARNKGAHTVAVVALGGRFDGNGVYYIDSPRAGGNDTTKITLLDAPNQSSIAISKEGRITWSAVANNNNGYELIITYGDGTEQKTVTTQGAQYTDANYANVVSIQIRALGNGVTSVSSEWVTWTK